MVPELSQLVRNHHYNAGRGVLAKQANIISQSGQIIQEQNGIIESSRSRRTGSVPGEKAWFPTAVVGLDASTIAKGPQTGNRFANQEAREQVRADTNCAHFWQFFWILTFHLQFLNVIVVITLSELVCGTV
jgi:hypothetical protein